MPTFTIHLSEPDGIPRLIQELGIENPVTTVRAIRGTAERYRVRFVRDGAFYRPPDISLSYVAKADLKFDANSLVAAVDEDPGDVWSTPATDQDFYEANPSYNTSELNALLLSPDGNANNDVPSVTLMGAFSWRVGSGIPTETERFAVIVSNKVVTGNEAAPTPGAPDLAGRVTDIEEAIGIGSGGQAWTDTAFLSADGDDEAGAIGSPAKPFETAQAAFEAGAQTMVLFPNAGGYGGITTEDPVDLAIVSLATGTSFGDIVAPAGVTIRGNGADLVSIGSITTTATIESGDPAVNSGNVDVRGCTIAIILASGAATDAVGEDGGNGGAVTLRRCDVTGLIYLSGGAGGAGGSSGTVGSLYASFCKFTLNPDSGTFEACIAALKLLDNTTATLRNKTLGAGCVVPFDLTVAAGDELTSCTTGTG
ncbi:MAG: hypothetical protein V4710_18975, partial [Verrucomicrobiota bacterium]